MIRLELSLRAKEDAIPSKVFVGNLNYETSQQDLDALFSEVGNVVEVFLPTDRATGRPRGIAFVELEDADAVAAAIEKFDGYELAGRILRVNEAQEKPPRPRFQDGGGHSGGYGGNKRSRPKGSRRNARGRKRSL